MKPYQVTIATSHHNIIIPLYAKDRKDAIEFVKRTHRAKFHSGVYKRVVGAKQEQRDAAG